MRPSGAGVGRTRRWLWPSIGVVVITGSVLLAVGLGTQGAPLAIPGPSRSDGGGAPHATGPGTDTLVVSSPSAPVRLSIPRLGLSVALGTLGLNPDGTVQVPSTADQAGWFRLGPRRASSATSTPGAAPGCSSACDRWPPATSSTSPWRAVCWRTSR